MTTNTPINRLKNASFKEVGSWHNASEQANQIQFQPEQISNETNVIYTFVAVANDKNEEVIYVGHTTQSLNHILRCYQKGTGGETFTKINAAIYGKLTNGQVVKIFAFFDSGLLHQGDFRIDLALGLKASLISAFK